MELIGELCSLSAFEIRWLSGDVSCGCLQCGSTSYLIWGLTRWDKVKSSRKAGWLFGGAAINSFWINEQHQFMLLGAREKIEIWQNAPNRLSTVNQRRWDSRVLNTYHEPGWMIDRFNHIQFSSKRGPPFSFTIFLKTIKSFHVHVPFQKHNLPPTAWHMDLRRGDTQACERTWLGHP